MRTLLALAAQGTRFDRAYCQFPVCGPARAALLSGLHARAIAVMGNGQAARLTRNLDGRPTLPQWFKDHGWHTVRVGKLFHMRVPGDITAGVHGPDHAPSWSQRFSLRAPEWQTGGQAEHLSNEQLRLDPDAHYDLGFGTAFYVVRDPTDGGGQHDALAADRAVALLHELRERPFFLAVGFVRPHVPLVAPAERFARFPAATMAPPEVPPGDLDDVPQLGITRTSQSFGLDAERARKVLQAYCASVSFLDAQVGRLRAALDAEGLAERTIVVFTSDHGYHLGEHGLWQKTSLHEESARVPLVVRVPGGAPGVAAGLAQHIVLFPTLAELCGLETPAHCQGASLAPMLTDADARVHDAVGCTNGRGDLLRTERHAYLAWRDGTAELYDMAADPRQHTNLADDPGHAEVRADLAERLRALR